MERKKVKINSEFITLGQLIKMEGIIASGGEAKIFLSEYKCLVNNEEDQRRGRKLYPKDVIEIAEFGTFEIE